MAIDLKNSLFAVTAIVLPAAIFVAVSGFEMPTFGDQCAAITQMRKEVGDALIRHNEKTGAVRDTIVTQLDNKQYASAVRSTGKLQAMEQSTLELLRETAKALSVEGPSECRANRLDALAALESLTATAVELKRGADALSDHAAELWHNSTSR